MKIKNHEALAVILLLICLACVAILKVYKSSHPSKYRVEVYQYFKKDHGQEGTMFHDCTKEDEVYTCVFDSTLAVNTGTDSVIFKIEKQ